jgi:FAD/FMN-containing dehydrogenase
MTDDLRAGLQEGLRGPVIAPGDAEYDSVRALYNGMIDKRPRLIARCADAADVTTAVNFGREEGLLIAIRGGGHNGPGLGSCDDGLMIDLSTMTSVRVDPRVARSESIRAARRETWTMPHTPSGLPCHLASSRPLASPG